MVPERHNPAVLLAPRAGANPYNLIPKSEDQDQRTLNDSANQNKWQQTYSSGRRRLEPAPQPSPQTQSTRPAATPAATAAAATPATAAAATAAGNRRDYVAWSKRETEALVRWLDTHDNFNAMKRNTARMLPMLAEHLQATITGCTKTAKQCDHKIRNLKKCYKKVKEKLSRAGTADAFENADPPVQEEILDQFPYFKEFERIMADEHIVRHVPRALLKLAADGSVSKGATDGELASHGHEESAEDDHDVSQSTSPHQEDGNSGLKASYSPQSDQEYPDMTRFRSIRPKDGQSGRCPVAHHQPKSLHTPESLPSPTTPHGQNSHDISGVPSYLSSDQHSSRSSRHPASDLADEQPDFKKQRLSNVGATMFNPFAQMMNMGASNQMFASAGVDGISKCPIKMDTSQSISKCPIAMDAGGVNLFGSAGGSLNPSALVSRSQINSKHGSSSISGTAGDGQGGTGNTVDENNPHGTLLNILKMMSQNPNSSSHQDGTRGEVVPSDENGNANANDESNPQETAQILAEHIKTSLAKKEAVNRQKLYLNHLQSQIQRHTMRAEMLYNNGQVSRASKVMDKIDELELELHDVLSRPLTQF